MACPQSSTVASGDLAQATQYNNLRCDALTHQHCGNVGSATLNATKVCLTDNCATALTVDEGCNTYLTFVTTNCSEKVKVCKQFSVCDATDATSPTAASVTLAGGLGVSKKAFFDDDLGFQSAGTFTCVRQKTQQTTCVSCPASQIATAGANSLGDFLLVSGINGCDRFMDVVVGSPSNVTVIQSLTTQGTPAGRTYTSCGGDLYLALASGTYEIYAWWISFNG